MSGGGTEIDPYETTVVPDADELLHSALRAGVRGTSLEVLVFLYLQRTSADDGARTPDGFSRISHRQLSEAIGVSERTIRTCIVDLETRGVVGIGFWKGVTSRFRVKLPTDDLRTDEHLRMPPSRGCGMRKKRTRPETTNEDLRKWLVAYEATVPPVGHVATGKCEACTRVCRVAVAGHVEQGDTAADQAFSWWSGAPWLRWDGVDAYTVADNDPFNWNYLGGRGTGIRWTWPTWLCAGCARERAAALRADYEAVARAVRALAGEAESMQRVANALGRVTILPMQGGRS